jgi:hypothetical protein
MAEGVACSARLGLALRITATCAALQCVPRLPCEHVLLLEAHTWQQSAHARPLLLPQTPAADAINPSCDAC